MLKNLLNTYLSYKLLLLLTSLLFIFAAYYSLTFRSFHDYTLYIKQWKSFLETGHPYLRANGNFNGNSYGPLYILLAYLYNIYTFLPRLIFTIMWFACSLLIVRLSFENIHINSVQRLFIWLFLFINPFFLSFFIFMGNNEIVVTALVVFGLYYFSQKNEAYAGVLFSLSVIFKFVPGFIIPFLFFRKEGLKWQFAWFFALIFIYAYAVSFALWQFELLEPFRFSALRSPKYLSIFRYFESDYSFIKLLGIETDLSWLSFPLMLGSLFLLFFFHLKYQLEPIVASIAVFIICYLFYKANHLQYHTNILILTAFWYVRDYQKIKAYKININPLWIYAIWMSVNQLLYVYFRFIHVKFDWLRDNVGLPTTIIAIYALLPLIQYTLRSAKEKTVKKENKMAFSY